MGRKPLFQEKAEHIMISVSLEDKKFMKEKGISPSTFFQEALIKFRERTNNSSVNMEFDADIEKIRSVFVKTERGLLPKESYWKAIAVFMEKYSDITKPEVMGRVERPRYYTEPKDESNESE